MTSRTQSFFAGLVLTIPLWALAFGDEVDRDLPPPEAPGVVASTDVNEVCGRVGGQTYSQRHRQTTPEMKREAHRGIVHCGEIDHRLPLSLGGADDVQNLWCEPEDGAWNFRVKDRLEVFVWDAVCHRHTMTLAEGQAVFLAPDWRVEYCRLLPGEPCQ